MYTHVCMSVCVFLTVKCQSGTTAVRDRLPFPAASWRD